MRNHFLPVRATRPSDRRAHEPEVLGMVVRQDIEVVAEMVGGILVAPFAREDDLERRVGLVGADVTILGRHCLRRLRHDVPPRFGLEDRDVIRLILVFVNQLIGPRGCAEPVPVDLIGPHGDGIGLRVKQRAVVLGPRDPADGARNDVGQGFTRPQILEANGADATARGIHRKREQVLPGADVPGSDEERWLAFGEHVRIDHDFFGRVEQAALAGVDGVVLPFHEPRVVEVIALAERHGLVVLEHAPLHLLVEPILQCFGVRHDGLRIRVLILEVFDDFRVAAFLQPVVRVDADGAVLVEAVGPHGGQRWCERRCRGGGRSGLGQDDAWSKANEGERERSNSGCHGVPHRKGRCSK